MDETVLISDTSLQLKRTFSAPCKTVFDAWKDPEKLKQWFGPNKFTVPEIEVDFPRGRFVQSDYAIAGR